MFYPDLSGPVLLYSEVSFPYKIIPVGPETLTYLLPQYDNNTGSNRIITSCCRIYDSRITFCYGLSQSTLFPVLFNK